MKAPVGVPAALVLVSAVACGGHSGPASGAGSTVGSGSSGGVRVANAGSVLYVASVGVAPANDATVAQITAYDVATMTPIGTFSAFPTPKSIPFAPTMLAVSPSGADLYAEDPSVGNGGTFFATITLPQESVSTPVLLATPRSLYTPPVVGADGLVYAPGAQDDESAAIFVLPSSAASVVSTITFSPPMAFVFGLAIDRSRRLLYALTQDNPGHEYLQTVDLTSNAVTRTLDTGLVSDAGLQSGRQHIEGLVLSPDGTRAYAVDTGVTPSAIAAFDLQAPTASETLLPTHALTSPECLAVSPDGAHLYVALQPQGAAGQLGIFDTATGSTAAISIANTDMSATPTVSGIVAVDPPGARVFVAEATDFFTTTGDKLHLSVFDSVTSSLVARVVIPRVPLPGAGGSVLPASIASMVGD
jgi:DNA-binding beta-propeller fold protein YncE